MAAQQLCDGEDQGPAVMLVHNLEEAEVNGFCLACMTDFCQAWLQQFRPEALAAAPAARGRKRKPEAAAAVADDEQGGDSVAVGEPAQTGQA